MSLYNKIIDLQKMNQAWEKVRKNKPAPGVDNVTFEQFEANKKEELKQLKIELQEHRYKAFPVRRVVIYKEDKKREIALYTMRDKVVQQSIACELNRLYDGKFSNQTYAYQSNKSALQAVNDIEREIQTGKYSYILKLDIAHFFDTIQWEMLKRILQRNIKEEDVLELIEENSKSTMLEDSGEITEKRCGIYQGSGISPILSNIYLMDFDCKMTEQENYYVRYSDDMIVLGKTREALLDVLKEVKIYLQKLGLQINDKKTSCVSLKEGINFLGYHFSEQGKAIPAKAEQNLQERLEIMWLTSQEMSIKEKIEKALEIIGGWEQYFREKREIGSIFEYVVLIYTSQGNFDYLKILKEKRNLVQNIYKDIMEYLIKIWKQQGEEQLELLEFEQYFQIWNQENEKIRNSRFISELVQNYRKYCVSENVEIMVELMQLYTDNKEYEKASFWMKKKEEAGNKYFSEEVKARPLVAGQTEKELIFNHLTAQKMMKIFVGREDIYSLEDIGYGRKRETELQAIPLSEQKIYEHLLGKTTIGTYIQRPNSTVKHIIIDIDISKKIVLQYEKDLDMYQAYLEKAWKKAIEILKILHSFGMEGYVEYSGGRGYHVWIFLTEWIPVRYANMFCEVVQVKLEKCPQDDIMIEFFPNKTRMKPGKFGQVIKLPYGYHVKTGKQSYFLDETGEKIEEVNYFLDNIAKFSLSNVKRVLAVNTGIKEKTDVKRMDVDLKEFGEISENVLEVLKQCNLMMYLCQKAMKTGYLTHFERLSILYVFGHLGEEGKQFVHQIMGYTLNYQYNVTEKFIQKLPGKPVSCVKLREQYKMVTAEYGCNCNFKRSKNCYPSPVLHAISSSNDLQEDITLPTSRTLSKETEKKVIDEINIHKKAQELAAKILEMKKQKRSLDSSIAKVEKELGKIYDNAGVDCLETEMGMLVRRKTEMGYEWLIEI